MFFFFFFFFYENGRKNNINRVLYFIRVKPSFLGTSFLTFDPIKRKYVFGACVDSVGAVRPGPLLSANRII